MSGSRFRRDDWIDLAIDQLKRGGPAAVTLDRLCAAAERTRGSFYHHFVSIDRLLVELAERWSETETESTATATLADPDAMSALATMVKRTDAIDHRLERGVRVIALGNPDVATVVEAVDRRREAVMQTLLQRAYRLTDAEGAAASRLFHALHQTAVMRSPDDIRDYTRGTIRQLVDWLPRRA